MKRALVYLSAVWLVMACGTNKTTLKVTLDGAPEKDVVLSFLNINNIEVVDTLRTDASATAYTKIELPYKSPNFYYLSYNGVQIASLLLSPGDRVKLEVDTNGHLLKLSGSAESELLQEVNSEINKKQKSFDSLSVQILTCNQIGDQESVKRLRYELGKLYVAQKQQAIKHLVTYPYSFTNLRNLYHQLNENFPLFSELTDGIYYKQLADSLRVQYPESPYVKSLDNEVVNFFNEMELANKIKAVPQTLFPELELPDINAKPQKLSQLAGRPFILLFWDPTDNAQKMFGAELEKLYSIYKLKGFEIYSVCITTDKAYWHSIVNRLPWINVCDGRGAASTSLTMYNVSQLPTLFIFDKEGAIVGKDVFDQKGLAKAVSSVCLE